MTNSTENSVQPQTPSPSQSCPRCRQADQTYKVSQIYLESVTRLHGDEINQPELERLLADLCPDLSDCSERDHLAKQFAQVFAPPPGGEQPSRRLHPDAAFAVFLLMLLVLLYQIATAQANYLPYAVGVLVLGFLAYLFGRGQMLRRHRKEQDSAPRAELALHRWGRLYFCSRDHGIFHPDDNRLVPLEEIQPYINES